MEHATYITPDPWLGMPVGAGEQSIEIEIGLTPVRVCVPCQWNGLLLHSAGYSAFPWFHPHEGQRNVSKRIGCHPRCVLFTTTRTECLCPSSRSRRGHHATCGAARSCPLRGVSVPGPTRRTFTRSCRRKIRQGVLCGIGDRQYFRVSQTRGVSRAISCASSVPFCFVVYPTF